MLTGWFNFLKHLVEVVVAPEAQSIIFAADDLAGLLRATQGEGDLAQRVVQALTHECRLGGCEPVLFKLFQTRNPAAPIFFEHGAVQGSQANQLVEMAVV